MDNGETKRGYRKRKRAEKEEETRRRITEAVVKLHRTEGPANTKVTAVAELAGVSRMTVYNHFPTEYDLIEACSTHWASENPFPNPDAWAAEEDPHMRLLDGLRELYTWFRGTEDMMGKVLRDAPLVQPLDEIMKERWWPYVDWMVATLAAGWTTASTPNTPGDEFRAALRLAVDFHTWRLLKQSGLADEDAAEVMARMVTCSGQAL